MRLTQLRDLIAIVDSGSIRAASRKLNITQPVLTRSVRELESDLGVQLLDRTAHGVVPTSAGKAFVTRARAVQNELGRMQEEAAQITGDAGVLKFGLGTLARAILPGAMKVFRRRYPATTVRVTGGVSVTLLPLLREGRFEFAIGHVPRSQLSGQIKTTPLFRNDMLIVGRRGHPLRKATSPSQLANADWLNSSPSYRGDDVSDGPLPLMVELLSKYGVRTQHSVIACSDSAAALNLLAETDVISMMDRLCLAQSPWREVLQPFDIKFRSPSFVVHLYHRADSPLTPVAAAMVAAIREEARKIAFAGARN